MNEREAFEQWLKETGLFPDWSRDKSNKYNSYHKPLTEKAWRVCQAAVEWSRKDK